MLPVILLSEPSDSSLVREKDELFITMLKKEMMENPISDVQPILCIVNLPEGAVFKPSLKEAYTYESIGGNHSREALQQILKEQPTLKENKVYSHKLCSVYSDMDSALVRWLASKHDRATSFSHSTTTWDRVSDRVCATTGHSIILSDQNRSKVTIVQASEADPYSGCCCWPFCWPLWQHWSSVEFGLSTGCYIVP